MNSRDPSPTPPSYSRKVERPWTERQNGRSRESRFLDARVPTSTKILTGDETAKLQGP